jgi:hypothetical protein
MINSLAWLTLHTIFQRFALAGVALNGAIYAVGGFNGVQYLRCCFFFLPVLSTLIGLVLIWWKYNSS